MKLDFQTRNMCVLTQKCLHMHTLHAAHKSASFEILIKLRISICIMQSCN